jgi:hypothetical protein
VCRHDMSLSGFLKGKQGKDDVKIRIFLVPAYLLRVLGTYGDCCLLKSLI